MTGTKNLQGVDVETSIRQRGEQIFDLMEKAEPPSFFSRKGFYGTMMEWAMRDPHFKTQLFRFVDVLPALNSSAEISRHLKQYLGDESVNLSSAMRIGLKAAGGMSWLLGSGVKAQVSGMARQFMLGNDDKEIVRTLGRLNDDGIAFTLDVLGETVVSEAEAEAYANRYLRLLELLADEVRDWRACRSNESSRGPVPPLNVSVKISAFYSQIQAADPDTALAKMSERLRPILRRAAELGALINFDMEHYALKDLTLRLFKSLFEETQFKEGPACGLAMQAYLKDCEEDLRGIIAWAQERKRRITVRLVKGAYWDYETIMAEQRGWPCPVFSRKEETDANFERLSLLLLENIGDVEPAFGTHNVRSIGHALAQAERLGVDRRDFEFQMLHGMAEPIKSAVLQLGCRLREYCPVGELLPGMAYLVRRLLENTSNEGFLAQKFGQGAERARLLAKPETGLNQVNRLNESKKEGTIASAEASSRTGDGNGETTERSRPGRFRNEPHTDFTVQENRDRMVNAIAALRPGLGKQHPLIINNRPVVTGDWLASHNPADQKEIVGYAAQGRIAEAEAAVAAARKAQPEWARMPAEGRAERLEKLAELMQRDRFDLCALEVLEAGKNWTESDADVAEAIDFCNFYAGVMRDLGSPKLTQELAGETNLQHWWPRGVGLVIAPWNFPLAILTGMGTAAVVAGNAIVMKPSDQTPIIGARLMELFIEAGLPAGVVNLLTAPGSTVGAHLVSHAEVDFIAFTGSKEVGLRIWEAASRYTPGQRNLRKVVCEMGGKNCMIVDGDADLDEAVAGCIASAFSYQGQKCSALSRLIVLEDNYKKFLERLVAAADSMPVGPAEAPGNIIGPVISREAQRRILQVIENGKTEAKLVWQGRVPDEPEACYVPPTIFAEVPASSRLFREEIFGPVLAVTKARDFDQAMALANESEFALTGGCFSRSPENIERVKRELVCGNLYINRTITGAIVERQPFGGFKMSGGGTKAGGREYLENFMVPRTITENCMRRGFAPEEAD